MGGSPPPPPAPPPPPPAPDYAAANREAVLADIETLPDRRLVEQAAKLGRRVTLSDGRIVDFTGLGDEEAAREAARVNAETADLNAQSVLDVQRKYGQAFNEEALKRIEEADPTGFAARKELAKTVLEDTKLGSKLSPAEEQEVSQKILRAQAARGNILGNAPTAQEIFGKFEVGQKLKQQRLGNVSQYVLGTPITAQYQNLQGAQNQAAPYQPVAYQPLTNLNPNAGQLGTNFAQGIYGTQMSGYNAGLGYSANIYNTNVNKPNPWMQMAGMAIGAAAGAAKFCWVAEELFGETSRKTRRIRAFVTSHRDDTTALGSFCRTYQRNGPRWASTIRRSKTARKSALVIWNGLDRLALRELNEIQKDLAYAQ